MRLKVKACGGVTTCVQCKLGGLKAGCEEGCWQNNNKTQILTSRGRLPPFWGVEGSYSSLRGQPLMCEVFWLILGVLLVVKVGLKGFCVRENDGECKKRHDAGKQKAI